MKEIIVDSFAGGGGASLGIAWATGHAPTIAINHDIEAIAMHSANHPDTVHVLEDVWKANLKRLVRGRRVGLLWLSPDCKHFSRAKGGKPVEKRIRSLAWIACKWADQVKPRVIILENVREFAEWGPLVPLLRCRACGWRGTKGQAVLMRVRCKCPTCDSRKLTVTEDLVPCPERKGTTFRRFVSRLKNLGYDVDHRNLDAADYGAPTHRKRLFLIARNDGQPIVWPEATHCRPEKLDDTPLFERLKPYRTAAECIDWTIECPSIFDRKKPLAEKTLRRIALGIHRYVINNSEPFIVPIGYGERNGQTPRTGNVNEPLGTIVGSQKHALVIPIVSRYNGAKSDNDDRCHRADQPITTLDTQPRFALVAPAIVAMTHSGDRKPIDPATPLPTITTANRGELGLAAATLVRHFGKSDASSIEHPLPTTTAGGGGKSQLVTAFIAKHFGGMVGVEATTPLPTTTMRETQNQIVAANLIHVDKVTPSGNDDCFNAALVYSFLIKYFGTAIGSNLIEPTPTATGKDRFGLVTINDEPYYIADIGMRMLTPRELARAQGFPDTYILTGNKTSQVARIGNSVCPPVASALVKANVGAELCV